MDSQTVEHGQKMVVHYGIPGMRWGRRKRQVGDKPATYGVSEDHAVSRELARKKLKTMSNAEIQTLNTRLNLERNYAQLHPSRRAQREAKVKGALNTLKIANQAFETINSPLGQKFLSLGKRIVKGKK